MHLLRRLQIVVFVAITGILSASGSFVDAGRLSPISRSQAIQNATPETLIDDQSVIFEDDFESGGLEDWSIVTRLTVQNQVVANGNSAARATCTDGKPAFAWIGVPGDQRELVVSVDLDLLSLGDSSLRFLSFRSSADQSIIGMFVSADGQLGIRNDLAETTVTSATSLEKKRGLNCLFELQWVIPMMLRAKSRFGLTA